MTGASAVRILGCVCFVLSVVSVVLSAAVADEVGGYWLALLIPVMLLLAFSAMVFWKMILPPAHDRRW